MARDNSTTTVVVVAGGAALLWLLLRGIGAGGDGFGLGGTAWALGGKAGGGGAAAGGGGAVPRRCALRLSATGLTLDGAPISAAQAVQICADADLIVTGDARQGELDAVRAAFAQRRRRLNEKLPGVSASGAAYALLPASMRGPRRW